MSSVSSSKRKASAWRNDETLDIRLLIQWKEIYELIESAVNRCEKLASFIESLMVKYA